MESNNKYWSDLKIIIEKTKCSQSTASTAYKKAGGNMSDAIKIARDLTSNELYVGGGSSGLAVQGHDESLKDKTKKILLYSNGIKVEEKFYDFKDKRNAKLKDMLDKREFDAEILGGKPGDDVKVAFVDLSGQEFVENSDDSFKKKHDRGEGKKLSSKTRENIQLPSEITFDENGNVTFVILVANKKCKIKVNSGKKVSEIIKYLEKNYSKSAKLYITSNNTKISGIEDVSALKNTLVVLNQE